MSEGDLPAQLTLGLDDNGNFTFKFGERTVVDFAPDEEKETDKSDVDQNVDFDAWMKGNGEA